LIINDLYNTASFRKLSLATILIATVGIGGCGVTRQGAAATSSGTGSTSTTGGSATPQSDAVLSVSSPTLSFGNVQVGTATSQLLSLTNNGTANLVISAVSISGSGYSVSGGSNVTLVPAQSVTVSVNFGPNSAGYTGGTLSVASNATNPVVQVSISGTGVVAQAQSHSVTLSWTPSTSQVAGYNIYRSTVSGGPYTKLNAAIDPNPSYTDAGLTAGTYFYVVTSVGQDGVESVYSAEVAAVVP